MNEQSINFRFKLKDAYGAWIEDILNGKSDEHIWTGYLITFMFNHIPGPFDRKCSIMTNEIERVYATLVRYVAHDSRSKSQWEKLPRLYAFPDYPRKKMEPLRWEDINANEGLHYHGVILIRVDTKLKTGLYSFVMQGEKNNPHLVKEGGPLRRIHIEGIEDAPRAVVGYAMKAIEYRIPDPAQLLILPKARSELPDRDLPLRSRQVDAWK
jgi:hypothetical protein